MSYTGTQAPQPARVLAPNSTGASSLTDTSRLMAAIAYLRAAMMPSASDFTEKKIPELIEVLDDGTARPFATQVARANAVGRAFAHQVLDSEPTVAVSAAPGIDPWFISWHCRHALRVLLVRDLLVAIALIVTLILSPLPSAFWLAALVIWVLQPEVPRYRLVRALALTGGAAGLIALYVHSPGQGLHWSGPAIGLAVMVLVFAGDLLWVERAIRSVINGPARPEALAFKQHPGGRLERIVAEQQGNAVPYFEEHIIGVGVPAPTPPINIKITAGDRGRPSRRVQPVDLLDHIMRDLNALARPDNVDYGIEDLEVRAVRVGPRHYWEKVEVGDLDTPHHSVAKQPVAGRSVRAYVRAGGAVGRADRPDDLHRRRGRGRPAALHLLPLHPAPARENRRDHTQGRGRQHLGARDAARFLHNITVTVFDSAVEYLDRCGVDVSEFKRQAQMIVTNIVSGSVVSGNLQMGGGRGGQIMKANAE